MAFNIVSPFVLTHENAWPCIDTFEITRIYSNILEIYVGHQILSLGLLINAYGLVANSLLYHNI